LQAFVSQWAEQSVDLSPWKNQPNLRIRFHLWTDGGTTEDGWFVDDVQVKEHVPVAVTLPFRKASRAVYQTGCMRPG